MAEVLKKREIKYVDAKDEIGHPNETDLFYDGLHLKNKGHLKLADIIVREMKK